MAQATRSFTTRRHMLASGAVAALAASIPSSKPLPDARIVALSADFDRLAAIEIQLWRTWDGFNPAVGAKIEVIQRQIDAVLAKIERLPGADLPSLRLKARAVAYFDPPETGTDSCVRERLTASILRDLAVAS